MEGHVEDLAHRNGDAYLLHELARKRSAWVFAG
jgi:hypothetical protein